MRGLAVAFGLLGFGVCRPGGIAPSPRTPARVIVSIAGFKFLPAEVTVSRGDTVGWVNDDALPHTTASDSGAWSSPEMARGERFVFVPKQAGRYPYHCAAHPVMRAVIVVRD